MAQEIFQLQAKDAVLRLNHYDHVNLAQSFNWDPAFNEEYLSQLGSDVYAAQTIQPEVSGSFEVNSTGASVALLKQMIQLFSNDLFSGYLAGDPASADNAGTIDQADLEFAVFDIIEAKKANEAFTRSLLLPRMFLSSLAWNVDANGNATETYNFEGEAAEVYRDPYHDLKAYPAKQNTGSPDDTIDLPNLASGSWALDSGTPSDGDTVILAVYVNSQRIDDDGANLTLTPGSPDTVTINAAAGVTMADGAYVTVVAYVDHTTNPATWPTLDTFPTSARFMKGDKVDIWLVSSGTVDIAGMADGALNNYSGWLNADQFLRCQTANVNVDLRREALREIKLTNTGNSIYYRGSTYPLNVTASASILETDLWAWQKIQGKNATAVLNLADFENQDWQLVIRYYYGTNTTLQTIAFLDARVTGRSYNVAVDGRSEVTWDFTGSNIKIEGSNG